MGQAKRKREQAAAAPKAITRDELIYFRKALEHKQQALAAEQESKAQHDRAIALMGAHDAYVTHLCEKYNLDPSTARLDENTGAILQPPVVFPSSAPPEAPALNGTATD